MIRDDITRRSILRQAGAIGAASIIGECARGTRATASQATTEEVRLPVALSPDAPLEYEIAATLTVPPEPQRKPIVQLLVPDLTYARYYFAYPYKPERYSYVKRATEAGYSTLNIDRIGTGQSSHPPPEHLTLETSAAILQQLIQTLQTGEIGTIESSAVMLVGHGYGALTAVKQQAEYSAADYLVLTGYTQQYAHSATLSTRLLRAAMPARETTLPRFKALSEEYQTPAPNERITNYYEANAESAVIAIDDRHRTTVTKAELETATEVYDASQDVTVPVLEIVGDHDPIFCGIQPCTAPLGARTTEPILWPKADFTMKVLPAVGHAVFLHRTAPTAFSTINTWMRNQLDDGSRG